MESNRIEGIHTTSHREVWAHQDLLKLPKLKIKDLEHFVDRIAPDNQLRDQYGLNIKISGPEFIPQLQHILDEANAVKQRPSEYPVDKMPWLIYVQYEKLHPFAYGNGRSARAFWLWMMNGYAPLGFLQTFYHQTLKVVS